jgi:2,5-diamino-6-(ribosylamino)-4(3H)-pyrimidinone 5'-phosphate reductase
VVRPYVIVNVAMSADGKISTRERRQVRISGHEDFSRVDLLKAGSDAVMVGIGTVLADDPSLTVKSPDLIAQRRANGKEDHPVRVVVDSTARVPQTASILTKGPGKRVVACSRRAPPDRIRAIEPLATIIKAGDTEVNLSSLLMQLAGMGIGRLMVEGGGTLIWGLLREGLVDEIYTFIGDIIIGGRDAPTLADGEGFTLAAEFPSLVLTEVTRLGEGVLLHWTCTGRNGPATGS